MKLFEEIKEKIKKKREDKKLAKSGCIKNKREPLSEYHECPVCGHKNKTKENTWEKYTQKYLDGQRKIPLKEHLEMYQVCPECGFIYYYNRNTMNYNASDNLKNIIKSDKYQSIRNEHSDNVLKMLRLIQIIDECDECMLFGVNRLYYDYYFENGDDNKQQEYLLKRIDEAQYGYCFANDLFPGQICIDIKQHKVVMHKNEVLTDLYRRAGQFDKAKECINYALSSYRFFGDNDPAKMFYLYELQLIENNDKSHI